MLTFAVAFAGITVFAPAAGESARNAVDFERRPRPDARQHALIRLSRQLRRSDLFFEKFLLVEGQPLPAFHFGAAGGSYVVVHAGDLNSPFCVFRFRQQFDQPEHRVGSRAAIHARVQIARRAASLPSP